MGPPIQWPLLKGLSAAVTGGTTGIGRAITLEFLRQGCNVAINHLGLERDEPHRLSLLQEAERLRTESLKDGGGIPAIAGEMLDIAGDVSKPETSRILVEKVVERWGKLDVFVANAGVFQPAEFLE
jgi:L-rhamnose 1-dehydrogenase